MLKQFSPGKLTVPFLTGANGLTDGRFTDGVTGKTVGSINQKLPLHPGQGLEPDMYWKP